MQKFIFVFIKKYSLVFILFIILTTALIPRLWKLTEHPRMIVDEAANLRDINKLLSSPSFHPADFEWGFGQATLVFYPTIALIKLGVKDQFLALRLTSVFLSILTLIPFFFIVKKYTNTLIAFCTTLLFSYSYYFLQFSRVGWTNIHALAVGLYFLWLVNAQFKQIAWKFALSGILAGILLYMYRSAEVYIFIGMLVLGYELIKRHLSLGGKLFYTVLFVSFFLGIALLWINKITHNWDLYTLRSRVVSISHAPLPYHGLYNKNEITVYQFVTSIQSWVLLLPSAGGGVEDPRYLPLPYPLVSLPVRILFLCGLLISLLSVFKKMVQWYAIFILGLFFGQIQTVDPPNGSRGLILLPVIYLFGSIALYFLYEKVKRKEFLGMFYVIFSILLAYSDFVFYQYWMSWIPV